MARVTHDGRRQPGLKHILIGLTGGVAAGLFFGEHAAVFQLAADGFVKLLQMAVLPYLTVSVIATIGGLGRAHLRTLGARVALILAALWMIALGFAFLMPLMFPPGGRGAFFSTTLLERPPPLNLIDLYIPANPFFALANNVVPAVVLFSVLVGMGLLAVPRKQVLLDVLTTASEALAAAMRFVSRLTPYGIFAIVAATMGTMRIDDAGRLQIYFVAYAAIGLLVALWVLPGLVGAVTPIPARALFSAAREPLVTAAIAGDLFIVLPMLIAASKDLLSHCGQASDRARSIPDAIVPIAYNFPHSGKLLSVSFILFAGWFSDARIDPGEYPQLGMVALVTLFGSINAAIPFLLDLFRIPADTYQLFLASSILNARVGSLVAAMHTLALTLLAACAVSGLLRWRAAAVVRYLVVTAVLTVAVIGGTRLAAARLLGDAPAGSDVLNEMRVEAPADAALHGAARGRHGARAPSTKSRLDAIATTRTLRVAYLSDSLPYVFLNGRHELVGFDVALMHTLAHELGVRLEFAAAPRDTLDQLAGVPALLRDAACDIVIGGIAVTTTRAGLMELSTSYMTETLGFVVRDAERRRFESWNTIRENRTLTVAVPNVPYFVSKLRQRLPGVRILAIDRVDTMFASPAAAVDAFLMPAERGSAWTLRYPEYAVVIPSPGLVRVPLAYALPRGDADFAAFINTWIDLKRSDGTIDALYEYWILGRAPQARSSRWSIIRDVLHWVD